MWQWVKAVFGYGTNRSVIDRLNRLDQVTREVRHDFVDMRTKNDTLTLLVKGMRGPTDEDYREALKRSIREGR